MTKFYIVQGKAANEIKFQPKTTQPHIEVTQKPTIKLHLGIFDGLRDYTKFRRPEKPLFYNGIWQVVDDARYEVFLYRYDVKVLHRSI